MSSKKNVKIPLVINVPKIGGFLPIVPISTALSALVIIASDSAAIAKKMYNARMAKNDIEEKKSPNRKIESVAVGEGLYLKAYRKGYGFFLKPFSKGKRIKMRKNSFLCYQITQISTLYILLRNIFHILEGCLREIYS